VRWENRAEQLAKKFRSKHARVLESDDAPKVLAFTHVAEANAGGVLRECIPEAVGRPEFGLLELGKHCHDLSVDLTGLHIGWGRGAIGAGHNGLIALWG
jgi:hypothetical protein